MTFVAFHDFVCTCFSYHLCLNRTRRRFWSVVSTPCTPASFVLSSTRPARVDMQHWCHHESALVTISPFFCSLLQLYFTGARLRLQHWAGTPTRRVPSVIAADAVEEPSDPAAGAAAAIPAALLATSVHPPVSTVALECQPRSTLPRAWQQRLRQWADERLPPWLLPTGAGTASLGKGSRPPSTLASEAASTGATVGRTALPMLPDELWELILTLIPLRPDAYVVKTFGLVGGAWTANPPAAACQLWIDPCSIIPCSGGRALVVDSGNNRITMLIAASDHPRLLSLAGGTGHGHNDGSPASARFAFPRGAAVDREGVESIYKMLFLNAIIFFSLLLQPYYIFMFCLLCHQ